MAEQNLKSQTKKAVFWSFFSNATNQGIQFIIGLILARLLSPADFGTMAMPMIFLALANCFIYSGFGQALVRKPDLTEADLSTAFYFNIIVGIVCYTILFFCSPLIADFYNTPVLADVLKVTALSTLFGPMVSVHNSVFQRNLDYKTPAKIAIIGKLTTGIVGIIMAFQGFGIWALVFQGVAGQVATLTLVWYFSKWRPRARWSNESFKYLFGFGSKILVSGIIDTLYDNIIPITVGKFYSAAQLGIYSKGKTYAVMPQKQISGMLGRVTFPVLCKLQDNDEQLLAAFNKMLRVIMFTLAGVELLLAALARPLVLILLTSKWEDCIIIIQLMCFAVMFWPVHSLNLSLFQVKNRSDLVLKSNIAIRSILTVALIVTLPFGIIWICIGSVVRAIIGNALIAHYASDVANCGIVHQFKQILPFTLLGISMFGIVLGINHFIPSLYLQVLVGGTIGLTYYITMAKLLKFTELDYILYLLHIRKPKFLKK